MHLHAYRLRNYRRFKNAKIELGNEISIFVGSNNSGKTSATHAVHTFVSGAKDRLNLYDFSACCWAEFDAIGEIDLGAAEPAELRLPSIDIDLWLDVQASDLYLVIPLLPSTSWEGTKVGIRVSFTAKVASEIVRNYQAAKSKSAELTKDLPDTYEPWPRSLTDYLQKELKNEYEFRYYVLDRSQFDEDLNETGGYARSLSAHIGYVSEAWERRLGEERQSEQWQREQRDVIEVPALTPRSAEILAQVEKMPVEKRDKFIAELRSSHEGRAALGEAKLVAEALTRRFGSSDPRRFAEELEERHELAKQAEQIKTIARMVHRTRHAELSHDHALKQQLNRSQGL
ncbi:ATP-binding protein [Agrobacterium tumefaciens]|nr:ATP-binding protein [Agrobacterium tumefaciens]